jgi:uncharacterized repeat protein (TIGR02543 family)
MGLHERGLKMKRDEDALHQRPKRNGTVLAAIALTAGLAAAPVSALAEESGTADAGTGTDKAAAAQESGTQVQPQEEEGSAQGEGTQAASGTGTDAKTESEATSEQKAPAASSDKGTYEEAGLHELTISYVDESGNEIAASHKEAVADGETYSVASPEVGGYELADASQATVAGTAAKGEGDISITVVYKSTMVTYKVVHERQVGPKSSEYRVSETETFTAPAGTKVTAAPKSYDNYTCVTDDLTLDVTPDGNATLIIKYDVIVPTYGIYFQTDGSYVAPITGQVGDAVAAPADPVRAGYSFAGWDTDGDGQADALPSQIPDGDVTAQAVWKPETATYLVKYWGEDAGSNGTYHLMKTVSLTGTTESTTALADKLDTSKDGEYKYYQYKSEDPVQISGDGTSVLNVYYDLKSVTVHIRVIPDSSSSSGLTLKDAATYSQFAEIVPAQTVKLFGTVQLPTGDEALAFYKAQGGVGTYFWRWYSPEAGKGIAKQLAEIEWTNTAEDADGNLVANYLADFTNSKITTMYVLRSLQGLDRTYTVSEQRGINSIGGGSTWYTAYEYGDNQAGKGFVLVAWRNSTNVWDGKDTSTIEWGEWHSVTAADVDSGGLVAAGSLDKTKENVTEFRYDRVSYDVTYYSEGKEVATKTLPFGSEIDVATPEGLAAPEGMVFAGWYTASDFSGEPVSTLTMPVGGVHLYAKWKRPDVHVTFDSAGGTEVAPETVSWGGKATRPAAPIREGYTFGGWYYQAPESSTPALFPFDLGLEGDVSLVAAWKSSETPASYTVIHRTADGTMLAQETGTGTVGETVTELALAKDDIRRAGYAYVSASGITKDLSSDASDNVYEFVYSKEPSFSYTVHFYDEATGLPVAADVDFDSEQALLDYAAPAVKGWHVLFGGQGYLSTREGGQELTFWYEKDPEPKAPATPTAPTQASEKTDLSVPETVSDTPYVPKHMAEADVPDTGDPSALAAIVSAAGAALAGIGGLLRRRQER